MHFKLSKTEKDAIRTMVDICEAEGWPKTYVGQIGTWKRIYERTIVYKNATKSLIVKSPNFILNPRTPLKVRVPTINLGDNWFVQPVVKKVNTKLAVELIREQLNGVFCDLHRWNVGWYDGKPVLFDW